MADAPQVQGTLHDRTGRAPNAAPWPGTAQCGAAAILSGLACWFWLLPQLEAIRHPVPDGATATVELAEVADADVQGALTTMNLPGSIMNALRNGQRGCGARLAWVTLAQAGPDVPTTVRIRSGSYFSPLVTVTKAPVRLAVPYPAPYAIGHGVLTVLGASGDLAVALTPAWHVPPTPTGASHPVSWHPLPSCGTP